MRTRLPHRAAACAWVLALAGCVAGSPADDLPAEEPRTDLPARGVDAASGDDHVQVDEGAAPRRGLGTMTARVPGSDAVVGGVRLTSHRVRIIIQDGFARTEIEEEFLNESARVLEGRYLFPLPARASISRLALWVGSDLVEGAVVERERAARVFRGIVEDTVRPRDPALLQWERGSELSMTIFPIPARGTRKVVLAYDEVLRAEGGRLRYVLPLSLGPERATRIDDFAIDVEVVGDGGAEPVEALTPGWAMRARNDGLRTRLALDATDFVPDRDFVVELPDPEAVDARVVTHAEAGEDFFAARLAVPTSLTMVGAAPVPRRERVVVLDASDSQTAETMRAQARLAMSAVRSLVPGSRFEVLACDSACASYPGSGLLPATPDAWLALRSWLEGITPHGASDLAGAVLDGLGRVGSEDGQLLVLHDGQASAGELSGAAIARRLRPHLADSHRDVRLIGAGRSVDEVQLGALARTLGATYDALAAASPGDRIEDLVRGFDQPVLRHARLELPGGYIDMRPSTLPAMRLGERLTLVGKVVGAERSGSIRLTGEVDGAAVEVEIPLRLVHDGPANPLLPRLGRSARWGSSTPRAATRHGRASWRCRSRRTCSRATPRCSSWRTNACSGSTASSAPRGRPRS